MGATNRQYFEKYRKKGIPKSMRKKSAEQTAKNERISRTRPARQVISGPAGEGFREGVGWFLLGFRLFFRSLTRPAPGGCGGCFLVQNGDTGLTVSTYPLIFDVLVRCKKNMFFLKPSRSANKSSKGAEKVTTRSNEQCDSAQNGP